MGSVFLPTMTPSSTDQYLSCPSQPSRSLPLNTLMTSRSPLRGGTIGGSLSSAALVESSPEARQSAARRTAAVQDASLMVRLLGEKTAVDNLCRVCSRSAARSGH